MNQLGIRWIAFCVNSEKVTYFDRSGVEHIPKEIRKIIGNKNIITNIYRIQAYDPIMCKYFCIGFIDFILKGKSLYFKRSSNEDIITLFGNIYPGAL